MYISIPRSLLQGLDVDHIRLSDVSCGATETPTHFTLHTSLTGCNTKSKHIENFVSYSNKVEEIPLEEGQIITRVREVEIPFACFYSNVGVVSAVGLEVISKKIIFSKKGFGEFTLQMNIFRDNRFLDNYEKEDFPLEVTLRQQLFVEVSVETEDSRLEILAEECFATPDPNPNNDVLRYTFIKDGYETFNCFVFIGLRAHTRTLLELLAAQAVPSASLNSDKIALILPLIFGITSY